MQTKITNFFDLKSKKQEEKQAISFPINVTPTFDNTQVIRDDDLYITITPNIFSERECKQMYDALFKNIKWTHPHTRKDGSLRHQRNKAIFGSIATYRTVYQGKENLTQVRPWDEMDGLEQIGKFLSEVTQEKYNVCAIQYYNNGNVGIKPHRDKEMVQGTVITSLSLGCTRTMRFSRDGYEDHNLRLDAGTLCCIYHLQTIVGCTRYH